MSFLRDMVNERGLILVLPVVAGFCHDLLEDDGCHGMLHDIVHVLMVRRCDCIIL